MSTSWLLEQSKKGNIEAIVADLHRRHKSKAIRIGPNELHISDVDLYKVIYNQVSPFPKYKDFYDAFGTPHTVFVESNTDLHKVRRKTLNPFFSRSATLQMQPMIEKRLGQLTTRLDQSVGKVCNMSNAFRCLTVDIISEYAFGEALELTTNSNANFHHHFLEAFDALADGIWDFAYSPTLRMLSAWTPRWIAEKSAKLAPIFGLIDYAESSIANLRLRPKTQGRTVIFEALESLTPVEANAEALDFFAAGSDTTAYTLSVALAALASHSAVKKRLAEELREALPSDSLLPLAELEKLPYLAACVKESLRYAKAVPGRLPRVVPASSDKPFLVDNKVVPPGTIVGMSATTMHQSVELWGSDATAFNPDRWLKDKSLAQNMVTFSRGSRSCLGQNMATAEITIVLAKLFRRYDFELARGSAMLPGLDRFTLELRKPGLLTYVIPLVH